VADLFERYERRDAAEVLTSGKLPAPIEYESHREFVRETLRGEVALTAVGTEFVPFDAVPAGGLSERYREHLNSEGSPSERVAIGYAFNPGTELKKQAPRTSVPTALPPIH